ncbi:MAG: oligopeptide/dipeptide ABC transporter ATP-binding protein [Pseudonocardiaceae bacterium]
MWPRCARRPSARWWAWPPVRRGGHAAAAFFARPAHPYGRGLLGALIERGGVPIPGLTPELTALPPGCPFAPRCPEALDLCRDALPALYPIDDGKVRCVRHADR